jgi:hypothetical protein
VKTPGPDHRPTRARTAGLILAGLGLICGSSLAAQPPGDQDSAELKRLVERIARGDDVEAAAASDQLIQRVVGPLTEAIGSLDRRSVEEQMRLRRVLERLTGALRTRLFRMGLPPADARLFDRFAAAYPELVQRLFDADWRVRRAALLQIPLEANTGAGVLVAAKVNDEDEDVAREALRVAARLHDPVVARNLARYIDDATKTIAAGFYGPEQQDIARAVALLVLGSIRVVATAEARESTPVLVDALRFFGRSRYWDPHQRAVVIGALGELGDRRAEPALLDFLDDEAPLRWKAEVNGKRISQTVGDAALLSLLRLYGLEPATFGMHAPPSEEELAGYTDDESRREGHRAFRIWHQQHGQQQRLPASQPTSQPTKRKD